MSSGTSHSPRPTGAEARAPIRFRDDDLRAGAAGAARRATGAVRRATGATGRAAGVATAAARVAAVSAVAACRAARDRVVPTAAGGGFLVIPAAGDGQAGHSERAQNKTDCRTHGSGSLP